MNKQTRYAASLLILSACLFPSCEAMRNVAATSFRVIDAPAAYFRRQLDAESETTTTVTTTTTTTADSDVVAPGRVIDSAPSGAQRKTASGRRSSPTPSSSTRRSGADATTKPSPSRPSRPTVTQQDGQPPYAKPVPGKPGYVVSPFDPNGGYVDVTGYPPGSKAKDPYSKKIFIVP